MFSRVIHSHPYYSTLAIQTYEPLPKFTMMDMPAISDFGVFIKKLQFSMQHNTSSINFTPHDHDIVTYADRLLTALKLGWVNLILSALRFIRLGWVAQSCIHYQFHSSSV